MLKKILSSMALSMLLFSLNSCDKNDDDGPAEPARFMVVHSSPGSPAVELYLDDVKASAAAIPFGTASGYNSIAGKQYNVKFAAVNTINPLAETTINLDAGRQYSIFAYDTLLNNKIKIFSLQDDLSAPAAGKAKVRFIHLSPGTNSPNVDILANNTVVFPNRSFADNVKDGSKANFVAMDAGTYTLDVKLAGSSLPSILTVPGVSIEAGKVYTIVAKGRVDGSGETALATQLIVNN
jgi:hypothetical protein